VRFKSVSGSETSVVTSAIFSSTATSSVATSSSFE